MDSESLIKQLSDPIIHYQQRVEMKLREWLPPLTSQPEALHEAMRYAVLNGGKRIRPLLTYATGELLEIPALQLDSIACAVELIHAYSLVHDDLPAMDNDTLRRGKPTVHIAFGEALAILVGDALQSLAFAVLATDPELANNATGRIRALVHLATSIGSEGMVGGQALDMEGEKQTLTVEAIQGMYHFKTGQLITASIVMPCLLLHAQTNDITRQLWHFGDCLGLAFQIRDDILEIEGTTATIGKSQDSDKNKGKSTYPAIVGLEQAKQKEQALYQEALSILTPFGDKAETLLAVSKLLMERTN